jgi:hypothetical protein
MPQELAERVRPYREIASRWHTDEIVWMNGISRVIQQGDKADGDVASLIIEAIRD